MILFTVFFFSSPFFSQAKIQDDIPLKRNNIITVPLRFPAVENYVMYNQISRSRQENDIVVINHKSEQTHSL